MTNIPPAPGAAPTERRPGPSEHIGPFRILQVLGEGGMGVVYEAEQTEPIHRRVALKVVKADVPTREVVARFEVERQALAVMSHESIAKVLDAGTSETGRPYFVMELVRGVPISDYCDEHRLSTRQRIELFIPVCRAVQHAHHKGVIHRDLKPSNVLVTEADGRPLPKIIDFGVAKAIGQHLTEKTLVTVYGQAMGTPAYMSPEQAEMSGLDVDTRTDVYSLGVMLYELLVGRLPVDPQELGLQGFMTRLVMRAADPPPPSAKLTTLEREREPLARLRSTDPESHRRQLRGELDWIVMRAMEQDRNRRYDTANGLALDLARYLADESVQARPPTTTYRIRKFARRHRVGVAAALAVVLALLSGSVAATVGLVRATRAEARAHEEAATAQQVSQFLVGLFKVSDPGTARGNAITARAILDSGAKKIETDLVGQPLVQARLMNTIGDVYAALGLYPEAERLLRQSLDRRERQLGPGAVEVGDNLTSLGRLYRSQGRYADAEAALTRAVQLVQRASGPEDPRNVPSMTALVELYRLQGRYPEAESLLKRALAILQRSRGPEHPDVADQTSTLAMMQAEQGRPVAAETLFRQVLDIRERAYGSDHPDVSKARSNLASSMFEQGKLAEAEALYRRALAADTKVYGPDHPSVALDLYNLGNVQSEKRNRPDALALYQRARTIWEKSFGPDHPYVAAALTSMGNAYTADGNYAEALPLLQRALAIRERTLAPDHPFVGSTHHELGEVYRQLHRFTDSERHLRRALEIRQKSLEPNSYYTAVTLAALGDLYRDEGKHAEAEPMYQQAMKQWDASGRPHAEDWAGIARGYAELLRKVGRRAEAESLAASARPKL
jgi:non-specific serine/threonine protein kinase/serine/threonine-protein kinase